MLDLHENFTLQVINLRASSVFCLYPGSDPFRALSFKVGDHKALRLKRFVELSIRVFCYFSISLIRYL